MTEFLLELYVAKTAGADVDGLAMRARAAADGLAAVGRPVRCARSILVPEDETCFLLFEAGAADDVREAAERAELPFGRISAAVADRAGDATTVVLPWRRSTNTRQRVRRFRKRFKRGVRTEHVRQISSLALFAGCSPRELRRIDRLTTTVHVPAGRVLCRQGELGDQCFIVVAGRAIAAIDGEHIATIERGELLGEMALLAPDRRRTATAWAETDMTLLVFTPAEFRALLVSVPSIARAVIREATRRLEQNTHAANGSGGACDPGDSPGVRDGDSVLR